MRVWQLIEIQGKFWAYTSREGTAQRKGPHVHLHLYLNVMGLKDSPWEFQGLPHESEEPVILSLIVVALV